MALLDQLRLLDRALRDVRVREALRTGDRGGRRLARFAGSVAPADLAVLRAVDARRFEAVAQRQAELIRDRWWSRRFPGILAGAAKAIAGTTRDAAQAVLASSAFDRREGEDETGAALLGWVLGREDKTKDPSWLEDVIAYEYMVAIGLPRRAKGLPLDPLLEQQVLPEGVRFLVPPAKKHKGPELVLAKKVALLPLEFPASQIRDALAAGQDVPNEIDPEPQLLVFVEEPLAAVEIMAPAVAHDILDTVTAAPIKGEALLGAFQVEDKLRVWRALSALLDPGILVGEKPAEPPPPPPPRKGAKGAKGQAKATASASVAGKGGGKKPAPETKKAPEKAAPSKPAPKPAKPSPGKKGAKQEPKKPAPKPAKAKAPAKPTKAAKAAKPKKPAKAKKPSKPKKISRAQRAKGSASRRGTAASRR